MQQAVSLVLLETIKELQSLSSLSIFSLAGGTNLAIRYNHRESQDIDLFCSDIVGVKHFETIEKEVLEYFKASKISGLEYPFDKEHEQYTYLRFWVTKSCGTMIKVEIIQNMKMVDTPEVLKGIRLVSTKDIGLFKLISGSSRAAKKDIYDLDFITEKILLVDLFFLLKEKQKLFNSKEDKNIFDLDEDESPLDNPLLLLKFERSVIQNGVKPIHSNDNILIVEGGKTWIQVKSSWRMKLRRLYKKLDIEYPM